jgi:hypothetical protein
MDFPRAVYHDQKLTLSLLNEFKPREAWTLKHLSQLSSLSLLLWYSRALVESKVIRSSVKPPEDPDGPRLQPLTSSHGDEPCPKALLPIGNKPMIDYVLAWLEPSGITGASQEAPV